LEKKCEASKVNRDQQVKLMSKHQMLEKSNEFGKSFCYLVQNKIVINEKNQIGKIKV
jgi:hypothetical protein